MKSQKKKNDSVTFLATIPKGLHAPLKAEAKSKGISRLAMLRLILHSRYEESQGAKATT